MKTKLPESIKTIEEAKAFLTDIFYNGESYHPEDKAADVHFGNPITQEEAMQLDKLMNDIYNLPGNKERYPKLLFDPCEFLLNL